MHCPECESFTDIVFDKLDLYLWCPLDHSFGKVAGILGPSSYEY